MGLHRRSLISRFANFGREVQCGCTAGLRINLSGPALQPEFTEQEIGKHSIPEDFETGQRYVSTQLLGYSVVPVRPQSLDPRSVQRVKAPLAVA